MVMLPYFHCSDKRIMQAYIDLEDVEVYCVIGRKSIPSLSSHPECKSAVLASSQEWICIDMIEER